MVLIHPFPVPAEGVRFVSHSVEALVDADNHGKGTLYITEAIISWINSATGEGFTIPYKKMTLHAISRDPAVHPSHCLYIMVNGTLDSEDDIEEAEPDDLDDDETTEVRFVPDDPSVLDDVYKAVQDCTLLHPDECSDMSDDDEEMQDDDFEGYNEVGGGDGVRMPGAIAGDSEEDNNDDEDIDYNLEQERQLGNLEAFLRDRLQVRGQGRGDGRGNSNGNGSHQNGNGPPFDPNQFADADE